MIRILFEFWCKSLNRLKAGEKRFDDVEKAIKFCWSMKKQKMFLIGWECVDPEDNEELNKRGDL